MDNLEKLDIISLIINGLESINSRNKTIELRAFYHNNNFIKTAFDPRKARKQINPRRGLQNYNRSEQFITESISGKLKGLNNLKTVLEDIKKEFHETPEWNDSNSRILLNHLDIALRSGIKDNDFTENQKGVGGFDYIEELLYLRYRLSLNELPNIDTDKLKKILLSKDEEMQNKDILTEQNVNIKKHDVGNMNYNQLIDILFNGVKATSENKKVKRKITIEVEDEIVN